MPRLIDITDPSSCCSPLTVQVGDLLQFHAFGGRIADGTAIEFLGPFVTADIGTNGLIYTPQGPPNVVFFRAQRPGSATLSVVTGDPFHNPSNTEISVEVGV